MDEVDEFGIPIKKTATKKQAVDEFGIPIKKKESSEPTSQKGAAVSPTRTTSTSTSSDTEPPTRAQASVALGGPFKSIDPFGGKGPVGAIISEQQKTRQVPIKKAAPVVTKQAEPPKEEDYFTGGFGNFLRGVDEIVPIGIGDFVDDMARSVSAGYRQGTLAEAADKLLLKGHKATPEQIQKFIDASKDAQQMKPSDEMQDYTKTYEEEGKGFWGVVKGLFKNPTVVPELITSSLVGMATNMDALLAGAATIGTGATIGATTGASAGTVVLPVVGTVGGATAGAIAGAEASIPYAFGVASSVVEAGSTFGELLAEELNGQDMTKENVRAILENPEKLNSIRNKAIARGAIIGTVDALTGKLASGVGAKIMTKSAAKSATGAVTKGAVVRATGAGAGVEAIGGSLGEATARGAVGQEMDVSEIALEGIAELPGGVRSTIQARLAKPSYRVNGEKVNADQVDELINTMTPEQLFATDFKIKNDYTGKEFKIQDKIVTNSIKQDVKKANPDLNEPSLNAITQLEKELQGLEGNNTQTGKDKAAAIRTQIKNIQENQIQEEAVVETAKAEGMSVKPTEKNVFYYYEAKGEKAPTEVPAGYTSMKRVENSEEVKLWNAQKPSEIKSTEVVAEEVTPAEIKPTEVKGISDARETIRSQAKEEVSKVLDDDTLTDQQKEKRIEEIVSAAKFQMDLKPEDLNVPTISFETPELTLETKNPFKSGLVKLGYSDADISNMTLEQQQEIVVNKTQAPEVVSSAKVDVVKENARQERIAEMQSQLDEEIKAEEIKVEEVKPAEVNEEKIESVRSNFENGNLQNIEITPTREGFDGGFLNDYEFLAEGSEHTVYRSKDGKTVIKIGEPYGSNEGFMPRVEDALRINNLIGDNSLEVIGFYESNGVMNPVYQQNYIDGNIMTQEEVASHLESKGFVNLGNNKFAITVNGKTYEISDTSDNFIIDNQGNVSAIDAGIMELDVNKLTEEQKSKLKKPVEVKDIVAPKEDLTAGKGLFSEPVDHVIKTSEDYKKSKGITVDAGERITDIDVENSKKIADAYDEMESNPNDPEVKAAYNAMANETVDQFKYLIDNGYTVELYDGKTEPYKNSEEMLKDLRDNKHLYVFSTEKGFGDTPITEKDRQENPLLKDSGFTDKNGKKLLINDAFRFVHDIFGHGERGNSFGAKGEENAWDVHSRMYSPEARRAMTTETRGQNSWVNFNKEMRNEDGSIKKKGDKGYLSPTERPFADQKIGLLPEWVSKSIYETAEKPIEKENINSIVETEKRKGTEDKDIIENLLGQGYNRKEATNAILEYNKVTSEKLRKEDSVFTKEGRNKIVTFLDQVKRRALSAKSFLPKSVFKSKEKIESNIKAEAKRASYVVDEFNKLIKNYKGDVEVLHNEFDKYLRGDDTVVLPNEFKAVAGKMRNHIDNLSQNLLRTGAVSVSQAETIAKNLGQYVNRSYEVFDNKNWSKQVTDQMKEAAKFDLRNMYRADAESKAKKTGMDADIILEDFINKKIDELIGGESAATFLGISKTGAKNLGIMKERLDIPLSIRQLMGEYTDASQNYARTVLKITTLAENARFLQSARESGMGVFFFNENDTNRPKEFNTKIAGDKSDTMSPLNGLYTTPEIAKAFAQKIGTGDAIEAALGTELGPVVKGVYETYMKALSSVKWLKTIGSVATHAKNVTGNVWFMMSNGYYNPKKYAEAFSVLKNSSKEDLRNKLDEYIRAGIIDQSAALGEIKAMFADADFDTAIENRLKKNPFQKVKTGVKKLGQKMTKAYQLEDDFFKIISYENEKDRYSNASFDKPFNQLTVDQQNIVKDKASEITKNILPNYSRIPGLVKLLKAVPVTGTFVSFQAEAYRTAYNTVALAANELKSKNNKVKAIGAKRLAGIASSQAAKLGLMALMGTVISGGDDEDEDDGLKKNAKLFAAPWSKDSDLVLVDYGNGKMSYIDFSASDPHGGIKKAYNAAMSGKDITESFTNGLTQLLEPFMKEDMLLNVITDIKDNKNAYGGKLYNESDTDTNKINAIMDRVYKAFEPGTITTVRKVVGSDDVRNELAGQLTGYKISTVDVNKQLGFKMNELKDLSGDAKKLYSSAFYKFEDGSITGDELDKKYEQANKSQKEVYNKMMEYMNAASFLGVEDYMIEDNMQGVGKSVINDLWYGEAPDMKMKEVEE
jgi:hypothetical protein